MKTEPIHADSGPGKPVVSVIAPSTAPRLRPPAFPGIRDGPTDADADFHTMHDTLARLKREVASLREKEKQHRLLFEKSPNPKLVFDCRSLRILAVNEAAARCYGYSRSELLGLDAKELCTEEDVAAFVQYCRRVGSKGTLPIEPARELIRHRKKNGTRFEVEITAAVVPFQDRDAFLMMAQDVTERRRAGHRTHAQHAVTKALAESATIAEASPRILHALCESLGSDWGELWRVNRDQSALRCVQTWAPVSGADLQPALLHRRTIASGEDIPGTVWLRNKPLWIKDIAQETRLSRFSPAVRRGARTAIGFPIRLNEEVLGVIVVFLRDAHSLDKHLFNMLQDITSQIGQVMGRRRVERQLLEISEAEQRRIGQDLHDGICQQLTGIAYLAEDLRRQLGERSQSEAETASRIADLVRETATQARQLARGLNPVKMDAGGLMASLRELVAQIESLFSISCRFEYRHAVLLHDHDTAVHLYRIAQEAIHNAIKHGKASQIVLSLFRKDYQIALTVCDNGRGLPDGASESNGLGIENMRYRARSIGAQFQIERRPAGGTILTCTLPSRKEERT